MPSAEGDAAAVEGDAAAAEVPAGPVFSGYGIASAVLAAISVAAIVLAALIWSGHHRDVQERSYQSRVLQTAVEWTGVLINMNKDTVDAGLIKLRDGTVGELNADFESVVKPYREVVRTLQSRTTGQIEGVAIESVHHDLDTEPGSPPPSTPPPLPPSIVARTDTVLVVATSVSENVGNKPQTVRWNLRLAVADVDGKLLISRLESMR